MTSSLCHHCCVTDETLSPALLSPPIYYWGYLVATPPLPHDSPQPPGIPDSPNPASETTFNPEMISFPLALPQNPPSGTQAFERALASLPLAHLVLKSTIHRVLLEFFWSSSSCLQVNKHDFVKVQV